MFDFERSMPGGLVDEDVYQLRNALTIKLAELRLAASIVEPGPDEPTPVMVRTYWEGIARGLRLACALIVDEVLSTTPAGTPGADEQGGEDAEPA